MKISLLDSGRGGIEFKRSLEANIEDLDIEEKIDFLFYPYGNKDIFFLKQHLEDLISECPNSIVLIACNTLSSLIFYFNMQFDKTVVDVITPTIFYLKECKYGFVTILATKNTIAMNIYERLLESKVCYIDASNLIDQIEHHRDTDAEIEKILSLLPKTTDALVLGCTHLIAIKKKLRKRISLPVISQDELFIQFVFHN